MNKSKYETSELHNLECELNDCEDYIVPEIVINNKPKRTIPKGSFEVPTWLVVLSAMFITFILTIFIAASTIFLNARRPGLHGEDCIRRSCEKRLGLRCINSTCLCSNDKFYLKGCNEKKSFGDNCHNSIHQMCDYGMICFNGKCSCEKGFTWNGIKCLKKGSYGDYCSNFDCDDSLNLICDSRDEMCKCDLSTRFWSGQTCILLRGFNQKCFDSTECRSDKGLMCLNGYCQCSSIYEYFDLSVLECTFKKSYESICNQSNACLGDMLCSSGFCRCSNESTHYFSNSTLQCTLKTLSNSTCISDSTCRTDLGLSCISNSCLCNSSIRIWDGSSCIHYKLYNEPCLSQAQCKSSELTTCLSGLCKCNTSFEYFDTVINKCLLQLNETYTCVQDIQCLGNMVCLSGQCLCANTSTHYFDHSALMCTSKTLESTLCSINLTCRTDLGLSCMSNSCQCDSSIEIWDGTYCSPYKLYNEACSFQAHCKSSQETICYMGVCDCNSTFEYFDTVINKCLLQLNETYTCVQDIQCLGNMVCLSGQCSCSNTSTHYFDHSTLLCTSKTLSTNLCSTNITCRTDLGLSCVSNSCQCDVSSHFWDGISCVFYKLLNETCFNQLECKDNQETICNGGICTCNSTFYFNNTADKCLHKLNESVSCSQNFECLGDMVCSSGQCLCLDTVEDYFNLSLLTCSPKTFNNTPCSTNLTCRTDLGLNCLLGTCECDLGMKWNGTLCIIEQTCPLNWTVSSSYCYFISLSTDLKNQTDAKSYCISEGGTLVNFYDSVDWTFFISIMPTDTFHIGLEKHSDGIWYWTNDTLFYDPSNSSTYDSTMWKNSSPGSDACGGLLANEITDVGCGDLLRYVCEKR